jgi:hypothetical protein
VFTCADSGGNVAMEIAKQGGFRDRFHVKVSDAVDASIALLAAVAIHSRFFEMV